MKNRTQYDEMITKFTHASGDREMIKHDLERTKLLINSTATDERLVRQRFDEQLIDFDKRLRQIDQFYVVQGELTDRNDRHERNLRNLENAFEEWQSEATKSINLLQDDLSKRRIGDFTGTIGGLSN